MLAKDTLEEFKLECELRRLSARTIKGDYTSMLAMKREDKLPEPADNKLPYQIG